MLMSGKVVYSNDIEIIVKVDTGHGSIYKKISSQQLTNAKMPARFMVDLGQSILVDFSPELVADHLSLLPTFSEQVDKLQLCVGDSVPAVVRFVSNAGCVFQISSNLYGFAFGLNIVSIGTQILIGITKINMAQEKIIGKVETVFYDKPRLPNFFEYELPTLPEKISAS